MSQRAAYARGAIVREIGFDKYHFAENLLHTSYAGLLDTIRQENTTL